MQPEPLVSIPLGLAVLAFGLLVALLGLGIYLNLRKQLRQRRWDGSVVVSMLRAAPWAALVASASGRILAGNAAARNQLGLVDGERLPGGLAGVARRAAGTGAQEVTKMSFMEGTGMRHVYAIPVNEEGGSGQVLMFFSEPADGSDSQFQARKLLGGISHELRTPLTAIMGHLDILKSSAQEEVALRDRSHGFISSEISRMTRLVDDLLQLTRLEDAPMDFRAVNPRSLAEEAISALYDQAQQKSIGLVLQADTELPRISGDADRLKQVLINLLDNAIKFAPDGGTAEVGLRSVQGGVRFSVTDTGPGIPAADRPHVFDPFFRGSRPEFRAVRGTGLGLTIVKSILDRHGASIGFEIDAGKGTRFFFTLDSA